MQPKAENPRPSGRGVVKGSYNRIVLVGNLTRDPEQKQLATGSSVTKFTLAVTRRSKGGDETLFIDVTAWDKLGDTCAQYLRKGASALVEGRLAIRKYDDKDGNKRTAVEVVASNMQMLDSRSRSSEDGDGFGTRAAVPAGGGFEDDLEGEIPF